MKWNGGSLVGVVILDKSHLNNVMTLLRRWCHHIFKSTLVGLNSNEWDWFLEIMVVRLLDKVKLNVLVMKIVMFCDRVLNHKI